MQFLVTAYDFPDDGAPERRKAVRPLHLANLEEVKKKGRIICAGGIKDDDGKPVGSFLVLDFENKEMLDEYLENEPYVTGSVWQNITTEPCSVVIMDDRMVGQ